jgi:hypothetical protein
MRLTPTALFAFSLAVLSTAGSDPGAQIDRLVRL